MDTTLKTVRDSAATSQEPSPTRTQMGRHVLRMSAATAGIVLCTVLPFLPGAYDGLAVVLSGMALFFGRVGLLLVPVGALWLAYELSRRSATNDEAIPQDRQHLPAGAGQAVRLGALLASAAVLFLVSFGAVTSVGSVSMLGLLILWAYVIWRGARWWQRRPRARMASDRATPLYLIVVPIAVALLQSALAGPMTEFSRNRAIENSASLIADIERYRAARGHYPQSLLSVHEDYDPSIIGIRRYHYEPSGTAYNVAFDQPSFVLGTREFVVYNPLDEQTMTSHNVDLLQLTPTQLELTRGFYAAHTASHPHWKSFLFD